MADNTLILGGSQFVGPALIRLLLSKGHSVSVLNRGTRPVKGTMQLTADRNDASAMETCAGKTYDAVVDLSCYDASQAEIAWRTFSPYARRWVHLSSIAVYADTTLPTEEDSIESAAFWGEYGRDKSAADAFLLKQGDPSLIILRPPYLYGPGNHIDRETFVWRRALCGESVSIPGKGKALIQFLHIEDLADALYTAMTTVNLTHRVYNVAGEDRVTLEEYVSRLADIAGAEDPGVLGSASAQSFPFGDHPCSLDTSRIADVLGWRPQYSFDEGFAQTFRKIGSHLTS